LEEEMKLKRIVACLFIVAALPLLASSIHNNSANRAPSAPVAFAGHVFPGSYWCECGSGAFCICDPGETPPGNTQSINPVTNKSDGSFDQNASFDFGSSALMMALAVLVWARFLRT
jgi:hypothetical protein